MNPIVFHAKSFLGQLETEEGQNQGFVDPEFEKMMTTAGWYKGGAWCGFFLRLVYMLSKAQLTYRYNGKSRSYITGGAVKTMQEATRAGNWHTEPVPGAVAVWRSFKGGKKQSTGHMGVVVECKLYAPGYLPKQGYFKTVEGNTTAAGSREGKIVGEKTRRFNWGEDDGLRLMGFVHPVFIEEN